MSEKRASKPSSLTRPNLTEIDGVWYDLAREGQPAWPGGPPTTPPHPDWTENEKLCWERIHRGEVADLNMKFGLHKRLHPKEEELWTDEVKRQRLLSPEFLEMVLLREPWRGAVGDGGVRIVGAYFDRMIDFELARVMFDFWLEFSLLNQGLSANWSVWKGNLSLEGTRLESKFKFNGSRVEKSLFMGDGSQFAEVDLGGVRISGKVDMSDESVFSGQLNMNSVQVGESLLMRNGSQFAAVDLSGARIGGQVAMSGKSVFTGQITAQWLTVGKDIYVKQSFFRQGAKLDMGWACIGGNVEMESADLADNVDFRSAKIEGEFSLCRFNHPAPKWGRGSKLILKRALIEAIHDTKDAWPCESGTVDLEGLTYDYFGGHEAGAENQLTNRPGQWFVDWLAKSQPFSPQPYQQCAKVLRAAGHPGKANKVMTALYERRRLAELKQKKEGWLGRYLWRTIQKWGIGYGLGAGYFRALGWGAGLAIFGWFLAMLAHPQFVPDPGADYSLSWLYFSLDQVIPLVELAHKNCDIMDGMNVWLKGWFVIQKLGGWILALLVIAGLTGLVGRKEE